MAIALKSETDRQKNWIRLLLKFHDYLKAHLKNEFVELLAPPDPNMALHDINVVVVVRRLNDEVRMRVIDLARIAEEEMKLEITLVTLTLEKGDPLIDEYELFFSGSGINRRIWGNLISKFRKSLKRGLGDNFIDLLAPPDLNMALYDINVVVVVRRLNDEVRMRVIDLARIAEEEMKLGITLITLTLEEGDPLIDEFRGYFLIES